MHHDRDLPEILCPGTPQTPAREDDKKLLEDVKKDLDNEMLSALDTFKPGEAVEFGRLNDIVARVKVDKVVFETVVFKIVHDRDGLAVLLIKNGDADSLAEREKLKLGSIVVTGGQLALAMTALGGELCPRLQSRQDTTIGWGMPLGTRRRCPVCQGIQKGECPNANSRIVDAWITDNPPLQVQQQIKWNPDSSIFTINNPSLVTDIPALKLKVSGQPIRYLAMENRATHEICLFAGERNMTRWVIAFRCWGSLIRPGWTGLM